MIAIFSLLGLGLLGGGLYAIYDGWPYLVLERGFTEVIIGSIAATGGLVMLSLAWVLKQLAALRAELAEAAAARLPAPASVEAVTPVAPPMARDLAPAGETGAASTVLPVAFGVGAAGLGAAAAVAAAEKPDAAASTPEAPERDLFGALVAGYPATPPEAEGPLEETHETVRDEAVPDMFEAQAVAVETEEPGHPVIAAAESDAWVEAAADASEPPREHEVLAGDHFVFDAETAEAEGEKGDSGPDRAGADERKPVEEEAERDEFAALRESLTSQLGSQRPAGRIEPSLAPEDDDPFAEPEAPVAAPGDRREPSFDTSFFESDRTVEPPVRRDPPVPVWPPRTEPQGPGAPAMEEAFPETADPEEEGGEPVPVEAARPVEAGPHGPDQPETETPEEQAASPAEPAPPEPAASDEGVVGAYQVGQTHFTIYADGSIRARTPEGEYSFASMDELKVYLASEKSRLGV